LDQGATILSVVISGSLTGPVPVPTPTPAPTPTPVPTPTPQRTEKTLALITTNALVNGSQVMGSYVAYKRQSRAVYVVTEDRTYRDDGGTDASGWAQGVDLTQPPSLASASQRADAIRAWLQSQLGTLAIGDVLLIGDPNPQGGTLPMKALYHYKKFEDRAIGHPELWDLVKWTCIAPANAASYSECTSWKDQHDPERSLPTDYYYSNLSSSWPKDADGDIVDISVVNFAHPDVNVGRIPIYSDDTAALDKILKKLIVYSTSADTTWRKNALLSMDRQGSIGDWVLFGEVIRNNLLTPNGFGSYRLYDTDTPAGCTSASGKVQPDLAPTSIVNMGSVWAGGAWSGCQGAACTSPKKNFGVALWAAHGGPTGAVNTIEVSWTTDYSKSLDDQHPSFTVAQSCHNANPYYSNNVGATLMKNGAIAFLGATRVSWPDGDGSPVPNPYTTTVGENDVTYGFLTELIANNLAAGRAMSAVRVHSSGLVSACADWHRKMDWAAQLLLFNLYGDPTVGLLPSAPKLPR
jgi:hypothetical protein